MSESIFDDDMPAQPLSHVTVKLLKKGGTCVVAYQNVEFARGAKLLLWRVEEEINVGDEMDIDGQRYRVRERDGVKIYLASLEGG